MNDVHFVHEEVDQFYLKDEPETDDATANSCNWEVEARKIVFHGTQAKCGDVFVGFQGNLTLVCSVCREEYETFDLFGLHIKGRHLALKSETEVHIEPIFTEPLRIWDETFVPHSSNRKKATENPLRTETSARRQLEPMTETSQPTFTNNVQPNQHGENTRVKQEEELDDKSSGDDHTPEDEAGSKDQTIQGRNEYFCLYCGRTYKSKKRFIAHSKKEHNNDNPTHEPGDVKTQEQLLTEPVKMVCKYCDQSFDDLIEFKNHLGTHTGRSRFVCPFCQKTFASRYNRKIHINTHTGERPFKCTHCPKAFSDATNLEMHIRVHLRIMKFACDYCDKRFVQSTEKKLHERTHTGEKPFQCEECGRRFISHVKLTEHGRRHKNIKNYKCEVCSKAFYTSTYLKNHMTTHTGERPFLCNICSQTFSKRGSLRAHQQLHSKEKKYVCDMCGKAFAQFAGLYSHRKSHGEKVK